MLTNKFQVLVNDHQRWRLIPSKMASINDNGFRICKILRPSKNDRVQDKKENDVTLCHLRAENFLMNMYDNKSIQKRKFRLETKLKAEISKIDSSQKAFRETRKWDKLHLFIRSSSQISSPTFSPTVSHPSKNLFAQITTRKSL